ncbi:ZPR1 zinc finger domain-containing protein [Archaeoglobus profundus]|uniref:ZPR1-related zinc finger protein n=1 Tax=Archaeoglobus profundus (strain DSM 5631 / JCM 9629 / NBRC 100127 / Av18) TaxID=572546 RepID=D2REB8_ARCPA|nr:ZPR1 zinc finger domain-containing protein [Archaeoglobus profundus]ADB58462.1 ZPR1-related zinc finger protein [Archaeoglobus profundus DSM 5631]
MIPCPACGRELKINTLLYDTPFFGKVLLTTIICECGFKHSDAIVSEIKEPTRFTVKINKKTLYDKVIRSTSGTIRVPEIGVEIEPGPASQAFITNLEGVLVKIRDIVEMARRWNADDEEKVSRCDEILKRIDDTVEGKDELTLILEDPFGNSLILSDSAFRERMKEEEAKALKTGMTVVDLTGLSEDELFRL